jgi:Mg-chelatase subunit ChlI
MGDRGTGKSTTVRALVDLYLQWMWLQMILSTHTHQILIMSEEVRKNLFKVKH